MHEVCLIEFNFKPMITRNTRLFIFTILIILFLGACSKNKNDNPYDNWKDDVKESPIDNIDIDPNSIQGLHKNIFKPTCSNSGCHDGNFEPDFRTIESTYNSLINRLSTNTDPNQPQFSKRVVPGKASQSMLLHRILEFIPGSQGKMPLTTDPGSDWPQKKETYIENISTWINNGAKDQFGNSPNNIDFTPQMGGLLVFVNGSTTPLPHVGYQPVLLPSNASQVKIMISILDDKTPLSQLGPNTINFSLNPYEFKGAEQTLVKESSPFLGIGVSGETVEYWYSITLPLSSIGVTSDVVWCRINTTDNVNPSLFIPSNETSFNFKKYFAVKIN
jgi:hypothetical protein